MTSHSKSMTKRKSKLRWKTIDDTGWHLLFCGDKDLASVHSTFGPEGEVDFDRGWFGIIRDRHGNTIEIRCAMMNAAKRACKLLVEALLKERK